jgi:3'(2'), 5'-bisphosphate nucleotidase
LNTIEHMRSLLDSICRVTTEAGLKIMPYYGKAGSLTLKADASPLTAADLASHEYLVENLETLLPGVPVISEESTERAETTLGSRRYWLVDPLDGTKEFVKGTGEFTVNVALIEAGKPVLGVVHAPVLALTYSALQEHGAWCRSGTNPAERITSRKADSARLSVVASKDHAGPLVAAMLACMPGASLRSIGSSLKFCLVAEGRADLYLRDNPTMEWDTAAAQCVVEAAGGAIYELGGCPLAYGKANLRNPSLVAVGDPSFDWKSYVTQ